jgi:ribosomal protein L18E
MNTGSCGMSNKTFIVKINLNKIEDWMEPPKPTNLYVIVQGKILDIKTFIHKKVDLKL